MCWNQTLACQSGREVVFIDFLPKNIQGAGVTACDDCATVGNLPVVFAVGASLAELVTPRSERVILLLP